MDIVARLRGSLVVSCQAGPDEPLHGLGMMAGMARAAVQGGARGIRSESVSDIRAIREAVDVPVIGLIKRSVPGSSVYITPTFDDAAAAVAAGAHLVALDATTLVRPDGLTLEQTIRRLRDELHVPVMADVSTLEEGLAAAKAGAACIGTTLSGYTPQSPKLEGPDWDLLEALVAATPVPVILEGRVWEPAEVTRAFRLGAFAVVVGSAITRPQLVTARFAAAIPKE